MTSLQQNILLDLGLSLHNFHQTKDKWDNNIPQIYASLMFLLVKFLEQYEYD